MPSPEGPLGVLHLGAIGRPDEPLCSQHKAEGKRKLASEWAQLRGKYQGSSTGRHLCLSCYRKLSPTQRGDVQDLLAEARPPR